jgi:hypothetical protein
MNQSLQKINNGKRHVYFFIQKLIWSQLTSLYSIIKKMESQVVDLNFTQWPSFKEHTKEQKRNTLKEEKKTPCLKKVACSSMEFQELHKDNILRRNV